LEGAGFESVDVEPTRIYRAADAKQLLDQAGPSDDATVRQVDGRVMSAFIRARKRVMAEAAEMQPARATRAYRASRARMTDFMTVPDSRPA
jgi:hypothetical protein